MRRGAAAHLPARRHGRTDRGDKFAVLAVACDASALHALQDRLRLRTAGVRATTGGGTRRPGEHLTETWQRADTAMYEGTHRL